jgi:hypothetical protein
MRLCTLALLLTATAASASPTLDRAVQLYERADFYSASIEFQKVLDGETGDGEPATQRAQFMMARTMEKLGFPAVALVHYQRIVENPTHRFRAQSLPWILELPGPMTNATLRAFTPQEVPPQLHDAYALHTGRADTIAATSPLYARAQLAVAYDAFTQHQYDRAIVAAQAAAHDPALAGAAARVIADSNSPRAAPALGKIPDALATYLLSRVTVEQSRRFDRVLDSVVLASACQGVPTQDLVPRVAIIARDTAALLDKILADDDNAEIFDHVERLHGETPAAIAVLLELAAQPELGELRAWHAELRAELDRVSRADKAWQTTQVAAEIMQELTVEDSVFAADIGKVEYNHLLGLRGALTESFGGTHRAIPAGPDARDGFIVGIPLCTALLAGKSSPAIAAQQPAPIAASRTTQQTCGGCAATPDPSWLLLIWAAAWLSRGRSRVPRPTARA